MHCFLTAGNKEGVYGWVAANYASGALQVAFCDWGIELAYDMFGKEEQACCYGYVVSKPVMTLRSPIQRRTVSIRLLRAKMQHQSLCW